MRRNTAPAAPTAPAANYRINANPNLSPNVCFGVYFKVICWWCGRCC